MQSTFDRAALRQLLVDHLGDAQDLLEAHGGALAAHRLTALRRLARCGDPADGFLWLRCDPCGVDRVVPTSCKTRSICPRCGGRRMASTAVHLVERVLPDQRLRQLVVTFPQPLPRLLAWCPNLLSRLLADLAAAVQHDLRRRTAQPHGRSGVVSLIQNFAADLRCFVHIHALVPDGVFIEDAEGVRFVTAPIPTAADIQRLTEDLAGRFGRSCQLWGRTVDFDEERLEELLDALGQHGEEAMGERAGKADAPARRHRRWVGRHRGVEVHAGVVVERGDPSGRERLARTMARPALSLTRLHLDTDGRVALQFKPAGATGARGFG